MFSVIDGSLRVYCVPFRFIGEIDNKTVKRKKIYKVRKLSKNPSEIKASLNHLVK